MNEPRNDLEALAAEVRELRARLARVETRRLRRRWVGIGAVLVASVAFAQLVPLTADTPARASQVNANFNLLKAWIEAKVGTLQTPAGGSSTQPVTLSTTTINGAATVNGPTTGAGLGLSVTGSAAGGAPIVDVRHTNRTIGVGLGWGSVFATGTTANVDLNLAGQGTGRVVVDTLVASKEAAYELSCGSGSYLSGLAGNPFCCRIDVLTGAVRCAVASNGGGSAWSPGAAYTALSATTAGRYHLSCAAGEPGANFPFCCRINANSGVTECGQGNTYTLGTTGTSSVTF